MGPSDIVLLCILFVLLLFSAFFSSAETALTTFNKLRLRMLVDDGNKKAIVLDKVLSNSRKMLSTVLIGNNIVNIAASSLTTVLAQHIFDVNIVVSVCVGVLTLVIIIFGEIIPKTVATLHAESIALSYAKPIKFFMFILTPVIFVLNLFSSFLLKIFRVNVNLNSASITEDELRTIVGVSQEEGIIEDDEYDMINNVFDFGDCSGLAVSGTVLPALGMVQTNGFFFWDPLHAASAKVLFILVVVHIAVRLRCVAIRFSRKRFTRRKESSHD